MGFFDDYDEEARPRRKSRRDEDKLDWQGMIEEIDEPEEEPEEDDTIQELEIDERGMIRHSSRDEIDPNFWSEDE